MSKLPLLQQCHLHKKKVFLRADLNVPFDNNHIRNDFRLQSILPTLNYLLEHQARVILATHIGKPKTSEFNENLSTKKLIGWFTQKQYQIQYEPAIDRALEHSPPSQNSIILLENLRFFKGEVGQGVTLTQKLAKIADIYVNDAFGVIHRNHTSVTLLPQQFPPSARCIGLLIQKEIEKLDRLKNSPAQPFILVLGGCKLEGKIQLISRFLQAPSKARVQAIIIGGALAQPFLAATGHPITSPFVTTQAIQCAQKILSEAQKHNVQIHLPVDLYAIQDELGQKAEHYSPNNLPSGAQIVDIGPETIKLFTKTLKTSKTIFANGTMGIYEHPEYQQGTKTILQAIAQANGYTAVGGGDASAAVHQFKLSADIDFISTGGGATLSYLSAEDPIQELPGLKAML